MVGLCRYALRALCTLLHHRMDGRVPQIKLRLTQRNFFLKISLNFFSVRSRYSRALMACAVLLQEDKSSSLTKVWTWHFNLGERGISGEKCAWTITLVEWRAFWIWIGRSQLAGHCSSRVRGCDAEADDERARLQARHTGTIPNRVPAECHPSCSNRISISHFGGGYSITH